MFANETIKLNSVHLTTGHSHMAWQAGRLSHILQGKSRRIKLLRKLYKLPMLFVLI